MEVSKSTSREDRHARSRILGVVPSVYSFRLSHLIYVYIYYYIEHNIDSIYKTKQELDMRSVSRAFESIIQISNCCRE
jgi:hypothetical protein